MTIRSGSNYYAPAVESTEFTWVQRMILRRSHPWSLIFDLIAGMWAVYFLWDHNWQATIGVIVVGRILGLAFSWQADLKALAQTLWGRLALLHLHPANLGVQLVGLVALVWGLWEHRTELVLGGLSVIIAGHAVGWESVHPAFGRLSSRAS